MTYRVKAVFQPDEIRRMPMERQVSAPSARAAIEIGIASWKRDGWDFGIWRWPEAENVSDAHDALRMPW
jgi:hypothetical protein